VESQDESPVVIAYDGSALSRAGIHRAAELFKGRPAVVATVWEPGLALMGPASYDAMGMDPLPVDPRTAQAVDTAEQDHAARVSEQGAGLARDLGLRAEPVAVPDEADVADSLLRLAESSGAAAVVIGSHGVSGLRSHLVGSVARKLLSHAALPVVVVRGTDDPDEA
jgi:nucleotide-binding universal stress UspA family protein